MFDNDSWISVKWVEIIRLCAFFFKEGGNYIYRMITSAAAIEIITNERKKSMSMKMKYLVMCLVIVFMSGCSLNASERLTDSIIGTFHADGNCSSFYGDIMKLSFTNEGYVYYSEDETLFKGTYSLNSDEIKGYTQYVLDIENQAYLIELHSKQFAFVVLTEENPTKVCVMKKIGNLPAYFGNIPE